MGLVVDGDHGSSTQHIGGPHEDGVADAGGHLACLGDGADHAVLGLQDAQLPKQVAEVFPVLGAVDARR